jgi:hypothetical protein
MIVAYIPDLSIKRKDVVREALALSLHNLPFFLNFHHLFRDHILETLLLSPLLFELPLLGFLFEFTTQLSFPFENLPKPILFLFLLVGFLYLCLAFLPLFYCALSFLLSARLA